jgi:hypothetical protein
MEETMVFEETIRQIELLKMIVFFLRINQKRQLW